MVWKSVLASLLRSEARERDSGMSEAVFAVADLGGERRDSEQNS